MRVLHVIPSVCERSGGPATAIGPMCRALRDQGVDVALLTTDHGLTQIDMNQWVEYKGMPARFFPVQLGASFKYSRPLADWLASNVRSFDVVHIHAVFNHASIAAAAACRSAGVPYIVRPLGTLDPWSMKQKPLRKRLFWLLSGKSMLQHSAAVHYTAQAEKEATEKYLRLNHGRVIPLGVEANPFAQTNGVAQYFPALAGCRYVLALCRLDPKKGLDLLIEAFTLLAQQPQLDSWRLVIAGDGPLDYVVFLKGRASNSDKVLFTGWIEGEQKEVLLRNASLLALPSRHENFGLCVMEAMARGVPVLLSPQVNLATQVETADAGWIVGHDALQGGLATALENETERVRRGKAAYVLSRQYSWEKTARDLMDLYTEVKCSIKSRH